MSQASGDTALRTFTLPNGLRVLLEPRPGVPRVAVAVHYGVGFRSEPPGREGFAHLFEHLMFRGSASLPDGRFYDHVHSLGGHANGTTHQDYTDYYQATPASSLEQALFAEADRMRAPRFTAATLAEQLDGVAQEIHQTVVDRPYGGFPWPLMPGVMFRDFANYHDGYGDPERLRRTTLADCAEFFDAHYSPGNAVLTVVGAVDPEHTRRLVERHFAEIPARPVAEPPQLAEPRPTDDRWLTLTEPGVPATAVGIGYRLPDPAEDLTGYLAYTVLARMMEQYGRLALRLPSVSASCGFFGPLDARDPDPLVVTAVLPPEMEPEEGVRAVSQQWDAWCADPGTPEVIARNLRVMAVEHHRAHADIQTRCRALGRFATLFDDPQLLDELPRMIEALEPSRVLEAAAELASASKAVLVMEPGETRTRPQPASDGGPPQDPDRPVPHIPQEPRPIPGPAEQLAPDHGGLADTTLPNGSRAVAVADHRAPVVEFRLRIPLGLPGWSRPAQAEADLRGLVRGTRATTRAYLLGGGFDIAGDGEWAEISGHIASDRTADWLDLLAEVLTSAAEFGSAAVSQAPSPLGASRPAPRARTAEQRLDDEVRGLWLAAAGHGGDPEPGADPGPTAEPGYSLSGLGPHGAVLAAVGDLDPEEFLRQAADRLAPWHGPTAEPVPAAAPEAPHALGGLELPEAHLLVCRPEPPDGEAEPARFLATAAWGGFYRSRLAERFTGWARSGAQMYAGRDVVLGTPRAFVRARVPGERGEEALRGLRAEARRLVDEPLTQAELEPVRDFCCAQLLGAFDSPAALAGLLCKTVSSGAAPGSAFQLAEALRTVPAERVARAAVELYASAAPTTVLIRS